GPLPHEPVIQSMVDRLRHQGLHPSRLPRAIDFGPGRRCYFCPTCDGYACPAHAKMDAETACIRPAMLTGNLTLLNKSRCSRLITDSSGQRVVSAEIERGGERVHVEAAHFVVSCGTMNSPALLLRSANAAHPQGLANSSGMVGRNLLCQNVCVLLA